MLTITAKFKQEDKQDQAIESLTAEIENFYQLINKSEFKKQIEKLKEISKPLTLLNQDTNECIDFCTWFDNLLAKNLDKDFIARLATFSRAKMDNTKKQLVSFFKNDRFCELRALAAALENHERARLSKPNSRDDANKRDLIIEDQGRTFAVQIKAGKRKNPDESTIDNVTKQGFQESALAIKKLGAKTQTLA